MRATADTPRASRRGASRAGLIVAGIVLFIVLTSMRTLAVFFTDYLWFDEVGLTSVWSTVLFTKIGLAVAFTAVFFVLMLVNLTLAERFAPRFRPFGPEDEIVQRYREVVGPHAGKVRVGVSLLFALIAGTGAAGQYSDWILFRNATEFGVDDPQFGRDIGFFMFRLPFLDYVAEWAFVALVIVLIVTAIAHYLNGGIRLQAPVERVTPQVKAHLSVLLGAIALVKAGGYYLQRYELSFSSRGTVAGASYTDVNAQLPALQLLIGISVFSAVLFLVNIRQRGWRLPVIALGLWAFVSVAVGAIYPAIIQSVRVRPNEIELERPFIRRNIEATRTAMGIDEVKETRYPYNENLTAGELEQHAPTVRNVRLWDPATLQDTYSRLQALRRYYEFPDVDIDRYDVDGELRQVVLSVRGLDTDGIPGTSWVNRHLQYTHGYGVVMSSANAVDEDGRPAFLASGLPPRGDVEIAEPRIYFGEDLPGYAVANSKQQEVDYQTDEGEEVTSQYDGNGGVQVSSYLRRLAFFLRFSDVNLLISEQVTPESRIIFNRDIHGRVRQAAPFLAFDSDPYPVVNDGRVLWVQDAYTTSSRYPYSQPAGTDNVREGSGLRSDFNYVRNSVKVVIDAYNGDMTFYAWDPSDPVLRAYMKAFPSLFTTAEQMPDELRAHMRYPEDLFVVQSQMYGRYHVTNPDSFFRQNDAWDLAQDPGTGRVSDQLRRETTVGPTGLPTTSGRLARMEPTYLLLRLPGDEDPNFVILQPFVPSSEEDQQINLTAFLTARSNPGSYGQLEAFIMPAGEQIDGPLTVNSVIQSDPDIARDLSLLDARGSRALLGQVQVIPIEQSLLYVRPLYVTAEQTQLPELRRVIVVYGGRAEMRPTLHEALAAIFGSAPDTFEEGPEGEAPGGERPDPAPSAEVADLLAQANQAFADADEALRNGDLAEFQAKIREGRALVRQAQEQAGGTPSTTTTTAASA